MRPAVFLDRDGVINEYNSDYVRTVADFQYVPQAETAFRTLGELGYPIVVITNQSGIGRGYTTVETVNEIHQKLIDDAHSWGATVVSVEHCPHTPGDRCACRKPETAMLERAAAVHSLTFDGSFMVGDSPCDLELAHRAGLTGVRVATGRGAESLPAGVTAAAEVANFGAAAEWIVSAVRAASP